MTVTRFEDLEIWQKARKIVNLIYTLTGNTRFSKDYSLKDQMRRCAVSLMANIAEGFSRRTDREFCQFLFIGKSSAADLQSHVYVALDQGYLTQPEFDKIYSELDQESRMLSNLIKHLSSTRVKPRAKSNSREVRTDSEYATNRLNRT